MKPRCWHARCEFVSYHFSSKLGRIVIDVCDFDDSGGRIGEAVHGVALHVSGLDDQGVLRHFLGKSREKKREDLNIIHLNCGHSCFYLWISEVINKQSDM